MLFSTCYWILKKIYIYWIRKIKPGKWLYIDCDCNFLRGFVIDYCSNCPKDNKILKKKVISYWVTKPFGKISYSSLPTALNYLQYSYYQCHSRRGQSIQASCLTRYQKSLWILCFWYYWIYSAKSWKHHTIYIWKKNIYQQIPPGTLKVIWRLLKPTEFAQKIDLLLKYQMWRHLLLKKWRFIKFIESKK